MEIVSKQHIIGADGSAWKMVKDHTKLHGTDKQGNPLPMAVAMIKDCIRHYRQFQVPQPKEIVLCQRYFQQVEDFCRKHQKEEDADKFFKLLTFDGVTISRASFLSIKDFDVIFHEPAKNSQA